MSWKLSGKPVTMKATRKLAEEWALMDPPPKERALSERRLQVYEILVGRKKFRPVVWAKAYCAETGGLCRVNGQHTSNLIARLEPTPELFVTLESYDCDTLEDVADLYATFDSKMQSRTVKDINLSFAGTCPELKEIPDRLINPAVAGMAYGLWGERYTNDHQPADRAELLLEHTDFVIWLSAILTGPDQGPLSDGAKLLFRAAPVAAMFCHLAAGSGQGHRVLVRCPPADRRHSRLAGSQTGSLADDHQRNPGEEFPRQKGDQWA